MSFASPRDLVRNGAASFGDRTAVVTAEQSLTYRQLGDRTGALAETLRGFGVGAGVQVAIMLPNSLAFPLCHFAVLEAGGIVALLRFATGAAEIQQALEPAGIGFLIAPSDSSAPGDLGMTPLGRLGPVDGASLWRTRDDRPKLETVPGTTDGFYLRKFSSDSTGRPKHILVTESVATQNTRQFCETLGLEQGERFIAALPFHYAYGLSNLQTTFYLGGRVAILPRFLPASLLATARRENPTVLLASPPMIEALGNCFLEDGDENAFNGLKYCVCSGARLRREAHDAFRARFGISVSNYYASSEAMGTAIDLEDGFEEGRVGRPFAGVSFGIFDDDGNPCPPEMPGRVGIRTPTAFSGYVGDPETTAGAIRDGYVFPGDVGRLDSEGRLHLLGRFDIINIGGDKVDRLEVERVIRDALPVTDVVVLEGERAGQTVVRVVLEADPARVTRSMVIEACRARLSPHKVPAQVEVREKFERSAAGKIIRASLEAPLAGGS